MFRGQQQNQDRRTFQPVSTAYDRKREERLSILQLFVGVTMGLFIAGIVVPSFLRSGIATNHEVTVSSLHTLRIGGLIFSYTLRNFGSAVLGALLGALVAVGMKLSTTVAKAARDFLMFRSDWRRFSNPS